MIRVIRLSASSTIAAVTDPEAVMAVSRLLGREWLVVKSPTKPVFEYYFDGARSPLVYQ